MSRLSKYVVVKYGDFLRGEHLNVAVFAWASDEGPDTPVFLHMLSDWSRVHATFPTGDSMMMQSNVTDRLRSIKTRADYERIRAKMGPYTPFSFTDECPCLDTAERLSSSVADIYLNRKPLNE